MHLNRNTETETKRQCERDRDRDRQTQADTDRQTDRQKQTDRDRDRAKENRNKIEIKKSWLKKSPSQVSSTAAPSWLKDSFPATPTITLGSQYIIALRSPNRLAGR